VPREAVLKAISGDHDAFASLVKGSIGRQFAIARLILRDGDRAQDAVQDALVSAWRDVRGLRDPDAWDAWLYRLTVRACYRAARRERHRTRIELRVLPDPEPRTPFDISVEVAERDRLDRRLGGLPLDQRAVMVLHFYLDLPLSDAADILGIPLGTAKSRLGRGLAALREAMHAEPESIAMRPKEHTA
jgi:RNA polymerase sigma-70 factor (ECF subfamily)